MKSEPIDPILVLVLAGTKAFNSRLVLPAPTQLRYSPNKLPITIGKCSLKEFLCISLDCLLDCMFLPAFASP